MVLKLLCAKNSGVVVLRLKMTVSTDYNRFSMVLQIISSPVGITTETNITAVDIHMFTHLWLHFNLVQLIKLHHLEITLARLQKLLRCVPDNISQQRYVKTSFYYLFIHV